jgi:hypothetical protein
MHGSPAVDRRDFCDSGHSPARGQKTPDGSAIQTLSTLPACESTRGATIACLPASRPHGAAAARSNPSVRLSSVSPGTATQRTDGRGGAGRR